MIYTNQKMKELLFDLENKKSSQTKKQCEINEVLKYIWPKFVEVEDCILIQLDNKERNINIEVVIKNFYDRTGFEAFDSHIHINDIIEMYGKRPKDGFRFALKVAEMWKCKLKNDFPMYSFHIILAFDGKDSILRFHKLRQDENTWCDIADIEGYRGTAVMVIEF